MITRVQRFLVSEDGPTAVEYAVMLALILVACITIVTTLGTSISSTLQHGEHLAQRLVIVRAEAGESESAVSRLSLDSVSRNHG